LGFEYEKKRVHTISHIGSGFKSISGLSLEEKNSMDGTKVRGSFM